MSAPLVASPPWLRIQQSLPTLSVSPQSPFLGDNYFGTFVTQPLRRPEAPWIAFIRSRNAVLDAWKSLHPSNRHGLQVSEDEQALRRTFIRFTILCDSITTPHEWWSELPREDLPNEESHSRVLEILDNLTASIRSLAERRADDLATQEVTMRIDDTILWLEAQKRANRDIDPAMFSKFDAWPFDGSYPNTPLASPPLFASESSDGNTSISSCSTITIDD